MVGVNHMTPAPTPDAALCEHAGPAFPGHHLPDFLLPLFLAGALPLPLPLPPPLAPPFAARFAPTPPVWLVKAQLLSPRVGG